MVAVVVPVDDEEAVADAVAEGLSAVRVLVADAVAVAVAAELSAARADAVAVADDVAVAVADDVAVAVADDVAVGCAAPGPFAAGLNVNPAFTYAAVLLPLLPQQAASGTLYRTLR
jgi:hypothetical protein